MRMQMYCKEFLKHSQDERWCGVIVKIDDYSEIGELVDVKSASSYIELEKWFEKYQCQKNE